MSSFVPFYAWYVTVDSAGTCHEVPIEDVFPWLKEERMKDLPVPREIVSHKGGGGVNKEIVIKATDQPGPGGAHCRYAIFAGDEVCFLRFQKGAIPGEGVNGLTNEALLAVVHDRLLCFQNGSYPCEENEVALHHVASALRWLQERTRDRSARGVEGLEAV